MKTTLGFIGLGVIGRHMALCLQRAGFSLIVHDLVREAADEHVENGAEWADSIGELAARSDFVLTSLPGPDEVDAVAKELFSTMRAGSTWIELSTNSSENAKRLQGEAAAAGVKFLEAPVSGGARGAALGTLAIWVGGDEQAFEEALPVLSRMSEQPFRVGEAGTGAVVKLVHNAAAFSIDAVLAEVFSLGVSAGVEPLKLWEAIAQGAVGRGQHGPLGNGSPLGDLVDQFLVGDFPTAGMRLTVGYKDISLAGKLAEKVDYDMPILKQVTSDFEEALDRGWKDHTWRIIMRLAEERARVDVKVDRQEVDAAVARYRAGAAQPEQQ